MGVVYRGFDPVIERAVAIKTLPRRPLPVEDIDRSASALSARFRHEAQAVGRLAHPGIVAVHEYGEEEGTAYIVMEHVDGRNLSQWLANAPRPPEAAVVHIMDQLLEALEVAHGAGVWHRDIKPANLLVTPAGRVKLTDFGIARLAHEPEEDDTVITGSPGYIAPEQYTGAPLDHRVDVFAAGVLLYRLLVGRAPFAGTPEVAMYKTLNEQPLPVSVAARAPDAPGRHEVPRDDRFDDVVRRAIEKDPAARYASAADFRHALRAAAGLESAAVAAPPPAPFLDSGPGSLRSAWPSGFGALDATPSAWGGLQHVVPDGLGEMAWRVTVEQVLTEVLGPIAKVLMRRAVRATSDATGLIARLAASIGDDEDRARFLRSVRAISPDLGRMENAAATFGAAQLPEWADTGAGTLGTGPTYRPDDVAGQPSSRDVMRAAASADAAASAGAVDAASAVHTAKAADAAHAADSVAAADAGHAADTANTFNPHDPATGTGGALFVGPDGAGTQAALPSAAIGHALRVLTAHLGAGALQLLTGAAGHARSTEELHALIVAQAGHRVNARLLMKQLRRGPH